MNNGEQEIVMTDSETREIEELISSDASPVGIDAKKTHVLIIQKLDPAAPVEGIRDLQARGVRVASFHPLFGPATAALRGSDVVLCDTGDIEAEGFVSGLFAATSARLVRIGLDEHDPRRDHTILPR